MKNTKHFGFDVYQLSGQKHVHQGVEEEMAIVS